MTYVDDYPGGASLVRTCLAVSFAALAVGGLFGFIQALHRTGVYRGFISSTDYYTSLTFHGVLLGLVFTIFFLVGLFTWGLTKSLERELASPRVAWAGVGLMQLGSVLATTAILGGIVDAIPASADVLYTFYSPLQAHPAFYIGLALFVVGTWVVGAEWLHTYRAWRNDNPDRRIPLRTFMVLTTLLFWYLSSLGVASEVVLFMIPWSLGIVSQVDPLLSRTLFWFFGHAVVYFWLMPAYFAWYTIMPKIAGGRLFSDPLARVVFVLFLLLSTPTGIHHQYLDPGIAEGYKFIAMTNTMFLLLPSFLTAFTVVASLEHGARQRGGTGYFGWLRTLPWDSPAFVGMALAGLMFAAGGFSGMVNAGMNLNYLIHNTIWVPGHFHLTVGTAAALTFMAVGYWLLPKVTGKRLRFRTLALLQPYLWFVGMTLMSNAMHRAGLLGVPRRTAEPEFNQAAAEFGSSVGTYGEMRIQIAIGGVLLTVSLLLFLLVVTATWLGGRDTEIPTADTMNPLSGAEHAPAVLDDIRLWAAIAVLLVVLAYGIPLWDLAADGLHWPGSPGVPV